MSLKLSSARNISSKSSSLCWQCRLKCVSRHVSSFPRFPRLTPPSSLHLRSTRGLAPSRTAVESFTPSRAPGITRHHQRSLSTSRSLENTDTIDEHGPASELPEPPWLDGSNPSKNNESYKPPQPEDESLAFSYPHGKRKIALGGALSSRKAALKRYQVQRTENIRLDLQKWADDPANQTTLGYFDEGFAASPDYNTRTPNEATAALQPPNEFSSDLIEEFDRLEALSGDADDATAQRPRGALMHLGRTFITDSQGLVIGKIGKFDLLYLPSGKLVLNDRPAEIHLVRGFVSLEELAPLLAYVPKDLPPIFSEADISRFNHCIPREVGAPIINKMEAFATEVDLEFRRYSSALEAAHEKLSHPTETKFMLLEEIAKHVTGKADDEPSEPLLFAVARFIVSDLGFRAIPIHTAAHRAFIIEPRELVLALNRVRKWVRAYQEEAALITGNFTVPQELKEQSSPLKSFARKCRILAQRSRELRDYSGLGQPLRAKPEVISQDDASSGFINSLEFSASDRDFIRCLLYGTIGRSRGTDFRSLGPSILKATGIYDVPLLDASYSHRLLIEIGVIQPWEDYAPSDQSIMVPNEELSQWNATVEDQISQGETVEKAANLQDSMAHLRKDWGDLPVFAIDSINTELIDDGISFEPVQGTSDQYWFHLHIAHLSAFTSQDHPVGRQAFHRLAGGYYGDKAVHIFPRWLNSRFSLESGSPTITTSIRVDDEGNILETKVQPGVIRNFRQVNFEQLSEAMDLKLHSQRTEEDYQWWLNVGDKTAWKDSSRELMTDSSGGKEPSHILATDKVADPEWNINNQDRPNQTSEYLRPGEKPVLERMLMLAGKLATKYVQSPFQVPTLERQSAFLSQYSGLAAVRLDSLPKHARFATEDPQMRYPMGSHLLLNQHGKGPSPSSDWMLALKELVFAASYSLGKWADERNIPLVYLGSGVMMDGFTSTGGLQSFRMALFTLTGENDPVKFRQLKQSILRTLHMPKLSSQPLRDSYTGQTHMVNMSSPLRKFPDLLTWWQVDAALREEASRGCSLVGETDTSYLPVSRSQMDKIIRHIIFRRYVIDSFRHRHELHFESLALARAFYLNDGELPQYFTAVITNPVIATLRADLLEIKTSAFFPEEPGEDGNECKLNEVWQVRLTDINPFTHHFHVKLVKRLKTAEEYLHSGLDGVPKFVGPEAEPRESHTPGAIAEALSPQSESKHVEDTSSSSSNEPPLAGTAAM